MKSSESKSTWTSDAIERGDVGAIRDMVRKNSDYLKDRDYVGDTPLLTAISFDHLELVRFLLSHRSDPNVEVDDGYTCLLTAIESEAEASILIVAELICAGADIHATGTNGWTPLHMAAARGHIEKARLLIEASAEVNRRKEIDAAETPLMEAAYMGQPATVQLLLDHGADPTMRDTIDGRTSLEMAKDAAKGPDPGVVDLLKEEDFTTDTNELADGLELSDEQADELNRLVSEADMAQSYIDSAQELARTGNHREVIRILIAHTR